MGAHLANYHCNATAGIELTHHFLTKLLASGRKGCVVFTSSPAGFMPCPFSSMYGATKAFLTEFASSIAAEVRADGVDITVVHPSPTNSNFYARKDTHALDALAFFKSTATGPERIARKALQCVGRQVVCDQGYYSICLLYTSPSPRDKRQSRMPSSA